MDWVLGSRKYSRTEDYVFSYISFRSRPFHSSVQQIPFPLQLSLTQAHCYNITHIQLQMFNIPSLNYRFLLFRASIGVKKDDIGEKKKEF